MIFFLFLLRHGMGIIIGLSHCATTERPSGFVSLGELDPTILIEMRYFGSHNFIGRTIKGYKAPKCWLTTQAAEQLRLLQAEIRPFGLTLKIYDCYRPERAVNDFIGWAKDISDQKMKGEFYPRIDKRDAFKLGYIAEKSGHSRGSTVDLTLVDLSALQQPVYRSGEKLFDCALARAKRFKDNSIDMGTGYDCFDPKSATADASIGGEARRNRLLLKTLMERHGFENYAGEWWHFTLKKEPFPDSYFDFEVE